MWNIYIIAKQALINPKRGCSRAWLGGALLLALAMVWGCASGARRVSVQPIIRPVVIGLDSTQQIAVAAVFFEAYYGEWPADLEDVREYFMAYHLEQIDPELWADVVHADFVPEDDGGLTITCRIPLASDQRIQYDSRVRIPAPRRMKNPPPRQGSN